MNTLKSRNFSSLLLFSSLAFCPGGRADESTFSATRCLSSDDSDRSSADVYRPHGAGPIPRHAGRSRRRVAMGTRADLATIAKVSPSMATSRSRSTIGSRPQYKFPAQIYDCQAAVRWMRSHASELKIDPERIGGFGYSAGGHLVALLRHARRQATSASPAFRRMRRARAASRRRGRRTVRLPRAAGRQRSHRLLDRRYARPKAERRIAMPRQRVSSRPTIPPMYLLSRPTRHARASPEPDRNGEIAKERMSPARCVP